MSEPGLRNSFYRKVTRSDRRMTWQRRALYRLALPLALVVIRTFWRLCRVVKIEGEEHLRAALAEAPSILPCYWHQHQLFCGKYLLEQGALGMKVGWLISPSVDGEIGAMLARRLGAHAIRGSSTHTGARALRDFYQALVKDGISPAINPDGPRGPRHQFKAGAIVLAQISGRPIVPMAYAASRAWQVKWDRFVIPKPFARIAIAIGPPRHVPRTLDAEGLAALQEEMAAELNRTCESARRALG